jgi:hypothetical protein
MELCLRIAKYKKENKELLTYLLYEASDDDSYMSAVKNEIDLLFDQINTQNYYWMNKGIRKALRNTKKFIRYSQKKTIEVELLIYFCLKMKSAKPSIKNHNGLLNLYERQITSIYKTIDKLEEDLRYDYTNMMEDL